jgi:hypothetical protein
MLPLLALLACQEITARIEGLSPTLESLGYSVAVVRDPEQREHLSVALGAPRESQFGPLGNEFGRVFLFELGQRALVGALDGWDGFGVDLHWLGDIDGDDWPDFVSGSFASGLHAFSGATGRMLWARNPQWRIGTADTTLADVDGDGVREIVVFDWRVDRSPIRTTADLTYTLEVWSGASGRVLAARELDPGFRYRSVVEAGDVDGDGQRDLALLVETDPGDGRIDVHVSWLGLADLCEVRRVSFGRAGPLSGSRPWFGCVATLGALGDVDRDGSVEVLVGLVDLDELPPHLRPRSDPNFPIFGNDLEARGRIVAYDARAGRELWTRKCELTDRTLRVAGNGGADVDGDGSPDALVSEAYKANTIEPKRGLLSVVSGRDGRTIRRHWGPCWPTATFPHRAEFAGDLDGDGVEDYLATETCGAYDVTGPNEEVRVFSGKTGNEFLRFP